MPVCHTPRATNRGSSLLRPDADSTLPTQYQYGFVRDSPRRILLPKSTSACASRPCSSMELLNRLAPTPPRSEGRACRDLFKSSCMISLGLFALAAEEVVPPYVFPVVLDAAGMNLPSFRCSINV